MDDLIAGFRRFRESYFQENRKLFQDLAAKGQAPKLLLIGCSDSRVDPGLIFGSQPGEMFTLRNVANLVPPYSPDESFHGTSAAIEFAVRRLQVEHVVVLGHAGCGGVRALVEAAQNPPPPEDNEHADFIGPWMSIARSARDRALALTLSAGKPIDLATRICEQETVAISLANLMTFPWIRERVTAGQLQLHGWYFDLEGGELYRLDPLTNTFTRV